MDEIILLGSPVTKGSKTWDQTGWGWKASVGS